jgi:PAS domain-containing protein
MTPGDGVQSVERTAAMRAVQMTAFFRALLDAVPSPLFVVDDDVRIHQLNQPASGLLHEKSGLALHGRVGDALHCVRSTESPECVDKLEGGIDPLPDA